MQKSCRNQQNAAKADVMSKRRCSLIVNKNQNKPFGMLYATLARLVGKICLKVSFQTAFTR